MSIQVVCPACKRKMNAPDHLAGKKAKCPKCGKVAPVPANGSTAIEAAPKKPRPAGSTAVTAEAKPTKKIKKPSLPLKTFEEIKVAGGYRARIEKEIGDEEIVWMGRPNTAERMKQAWLGCIIGLVFTLLSPASFLLMLMDSPEDKPWLMMAVAGGVFVIVLLFGLPMLFMPLLVWIFINFRPVYVLTERRAIVAENRFGFFAKMWTYDRAELQGMEVKEEENGLGSIIMGYEQYEHQGTLKHSQKTYTSEDGSRKVVVSKMERRGQHTSNIPVGFLDVDEVLKVEAVLRHTLKLPARETES